MATSKKDNYKKAKRVERFFYFVAGLILIGIPFYVGFHHRIDQVLEYVVTNWKEIVTTIMAAVSICLCIYCLVRTIVAIACNKFLPKVPMPKNQLVKLVCLTVLGIIIGIVSPVWVLVLWIVTCLLGMATYSFV